MTATAEVDLLDGADEELGGGGPQERDWRGIGTALLVIMVISLFIGLAVFLFTPINSDRNWYRRPVNLSELGAYRNPIGNVRWIGSEFVYYDSVNEGCVKVDKEGHKTTVLQPSDFNHEITPSPSGIYQAHFAHQENPGRNPDDATIEVYVTDSNGWKQHIGRDGRTGSSLKFFDWGPKDDFVFHENGLLYYNKFGQATAKSPIRISSEDATKEHGFYDWMYDEEIAGSRTAVWWSVGGDVIAYASREGAAGTPYMMTSFHAEDIYPINTKLPYPKVGEKTIAAYNIFMWNKTTGGEARQMDVQLEDSSEFHYLFAASWVRLFGKDRLVVVWANRYQNQVHFTLCDFDKSMCHYIHKFVYPPLTWATPGDFQQMPYIDEEGAFFAVLPNKDYQRIAKISVTMRDGSIQAGLTFLNTGDYDVDMSWPRVVDQSDKLIYFMSHAPDPNNRHLYVTKTTPSANDSRCVSCGMGPNCTYQEAKVAPDFQQAIIVCQGPSPGKIYQAKLDGNAPKEEEILTQARLIAADEAFLHKVQETLNPVVINENITLSNGYVARAQLRLPPDQLAKTNWRSIPLLLKVYGGPDSQAVKDQFIMSFEENLVTERNIAVLQIDARGQASRGWKYKSPIYGNLGTVEIDDQIEATREILKRYPFLDSGRVAVFGWSYGGFATLHLAEKAPIGFFKCAVAVAPVTNFKYYDAAYTERYMGKADSEAYRRTDATANIENFRHTKLLLAHGMYDDNVHFQNSAILLEKLESYNVDFDLMVYPNQNHGMGTGRMHLYYKISKFLGNCFY